MKLVTEMTYKVSNGTLSLYPLTLTMKAILLYRQNQMQKLQKPNYVQHECITFITKQPQITYKMPKWHKI